LATTTLPQTPIYLAPANQLPLSDTFFWEVTRRRLSGPDSWPSVFSFKVTNILLMAAPDLVDVVIGHLTTIVCPAPPMVRGDIVRDIGQQNIRILIGLIVGSTTGLEFGFPT
jgi:hypothetical protein